MKIRPTDDYNSLYQDTLDFVGVSDTSSLPHAQFYRGANDWYRRADSWIWEASGTWEFDDSGYTNLPIATADLVDGQQDYEMPSSARKIDRVEVMDDDGEYHIVQPIDKSQVTREAMSEYYDEDGMPIQYDLVGRSIFLYPAPSDSDVTLTEGLKLYFTRDINEFETTDTSTEPGFDNHFHRIISLGVAHDYCISNDLADRKKEIRQEIGQLREEMAKHYGSRPRGMKNRIRPKGRQKI